MNLPGITEFTSEFFNESSKAWMANKVRVGAGVKYRCKYIHTNGKQCSKPVVLFDFCKRHKIVLKNFKKESKHFTKLIDNTLTALK